MFNWLLILKYLQTDTQKHFAMAVDEPVESANVGKQSTTIDVAQPSVEVPVESTEPTTPSTSIVDYAPAQLSVEIPVESPAILSAAGQTGEP